MKNIKILDCTLRDGGYVNEWNFGRQNAKNIIKLLNLSNIEYIETGFLTQEKTTKDKTLFNSFSDIEKLTDKTIDCNKLLAMIAYGKFPIEKIPNASKTKIKGIRLIFKKNQKTDALDYCKKLKEKGYRLFMNPTFVDQYKEEEFIELIRKINYINPYCMSIVDSTGALKEREILKLFEIMDDNLNRDIKLCFHMHNNLQLSFSSAVCLMKLETKRELIIDSTVLGMGRGAGILCTELLAQYINSYYCGNYDIKTILKIADEYINPIFLKTPWGYSIPYYLTALNHCHPNYAKYLTDKKLLSTEAISSILKLIPENKKDYYDENCIELLYKQHC